VRACVGACVLTHWRPVLHVGLGPSRRYPRCWYQHRSEAFFAATRGIFGDSSGEKVSPRSHRQHLAKRRSLRLSEYNPSHDTRLPDAASVCRQHLQLTMECNCRQTTLAGRITHNLNNNGLALGSYTRTTSSYRNSECVFKVEVIFRKQIFPVRPPANQQRLLL